MARQRSSGQNGTRTTGGKATIDPLLNRPPNADETSPETLIPETVQLPGSEESASEPAEQRRARIEARAYEIARERGFAPGAELDDWLRAEREIDARAMRQTPPEDQFTG